MIYVHKCFPEFSEKVYAKFLLILLLAACFRAKFTESAVLKYHIDKLSPHCTPVYLTSFCTSVSTPLHAVPRTEPTVAQMLYDYSFCLHVPLRSLAQFPALPFPAQVRSYCSCKSQVSQKKWEQSGTTSTFLAMKTWGHHFFVHNSQIHCNLKACFGLTLIYFLKSV